jgi:hypothetical protein
LGFRGFGREAAAAAAAAAAEKRKSIFLSVLSRRARLARTPGGREEGARRTHHARVRVRAVHRVQPRVRLVRARRHDARVHRARVDDAFGERHAREARRR